ncbi:Predicted arabinose efflux permease, MFS family [Paenibacillus polysaccharolyticus]|uniref:Predicted arabinose efflux permease, MFS family n=1 Tax=Paenibacillus polysaccharolyticus TaxID=582692 RepID=A0A1G5FA31_9BACL|nr:MFS transporter [Paenibacillus polysaccharolyticus]SCY36122.1 Predicted arabinose efflux permease, MFS family [Paenibacillus polysaccharolyticus]
MKSKSNYSKLFGAFSLTFLGDGLTLAAVPWLVSTLTTDTLYASITMTALRLPWLIFSLPVGVLIDRYSRKHMLVGASFTRMIFLLFLTICIWGGWISIPLLALFMFGIGLSRVVFDSTVQTIIPQVVEEKKLEKANGQFTAGQLITSDILGVALGGFIITMHIVYPFAIDTVTAILSLLLISGLRGSFHPAKSKESQVQEQAEKETRPMKNWKREMWSGIQYVFQDRFLRGLAILSVTITLMFSMILVTQIFFVREVLQLEAYAFGILISIATIGSILGSQAVAYMRKRWSSKQLILLSILSMGLLYGAVGLTSNAYVVGGLYFCAAFFIVVYNVIRSSILQRSVPNELLGRVGSVFRFLSFGISAIGTLLGGLLVRVSETFFDRLFSLQLPYLLLSVVYILACFLFASKMRNVAEQ